MRDPYLKKDIEDYLGLIAEERVDDGTTYNSSLAALDEKMSRSELAGTLLNKYEQSLREVLSDDALDSRALMRSAAMLHSATNSLFSSNPALVWILTSVEMYHSVRRRQRPHDIR